MKRVCSWCGDTLTEGDEPISHGICEWCERAMLSDLPKLRRSRKQYIAADGHGAIRVFERLIDASRGIDGRRHAQ